MADSFLLGIDGGGTSCRARLCDSAGHPLGEGRAGSANVQLGVDSSYAAILTATDQALAAAHLDRSILKHTHAGLGLAGAVSAAIRAEVSGFNHLFASVSVETDAHTACLGAHGGENGGILILGTGSCGVALVSGSFYNVGGWGFPVSDQGSGAWIGLELVRYALQAHDKIVPASALSRALMERFEHDPVRVVAWMDGARPRDYGAWVPLVAEYAERGDTLANRLLDGAAKDASLLLHAVRNRGAERISLMGGISPLLAPRLPSKDRHLLVPPRGDAMDGALMLVAGHRRISLPGRHRSNNMQSPDSMQRPDRQSDSPKSDAP